MKSQMYMKIAKQMKEAIKIILGIKKIKKDIKKNMEVRV